MTQPTTNPTTTSEQPVSEREKIDLPKYFFVFDIESVGLHGEAFAVGWSVYSRDGGHYEESFLACPMSEAQGSDSDRDWCLKNLPVLCETNKTPRGVRDAFWPIWMAWKKEGAVMVADCAWPVEARFLAQCVDDDKTARSWEGPYPLHDVASVLMACGKDPMATNERRLEELPAHHPMKDARQSGRLLVEALNAQPVLPSATVPVPVQETILDAILAVVKNHSEGNLHAIGNPITLSMAIRDAIQPYLAQPAVPVQDMRAVVELIARSLCEIHGSNPDDLEPGDAKGLDGRNHEGEPCHFRWKDFKANAEKVCSALQPYLAQPAQPVQEPTDKDILDWLDEHRAAIEVNEEEILTCRVSASDDFEAHGFSNPYNIREAIKAAMRSNPASRVPPK